MLSSRAPQTTLASASTEFDKPPDSAVVRRQVVSIFGGLKPLASLQEKRAPFLHGAVAREHQLDTSEMLGNVVKPLHDWKRIFERCDWANHEIAGTIPGDTVGEAVHVTPGSRGRGQEAIKQLKRALAGKSLDGVLGRDLGLFARNWRLFTPYIPSRGLQMYELLDLLNLVLWTHHLPTGGWLLAEGSALACGVVFLSQRLKLDPDFKIATTPKGHAVGELPWANFLNVLHSMRRDARVASPSAANDQPVEQEFACWGRALKLTGYGFDAAQMAESITRVRGAQVASLGTPAPQRCTPTCLRLRTLFALLVPQQLTDHGGIDCGRCADRSVTDQRRRPEARPRQAPAAPVGRAGASNLVVRLAHARGRRRGVHQLPDVVWRRGVSRGMLPAPEPILSDSLELWSTSLTVAFRFLARQLECCYIRFGPASAEQPQYVDISNVQLQRGCDTHGDGARIISVCSCADACHRRLGGSAPPPPPCTNPLHADCPGCFWPGSPKQRAAAAQRSLDETTARAAATAAEERVAALRNIAGAPSFVICVSQRGLHAEPLTGVSAEETLVVKRSEPGLPGAVVYVKALLSMVVNVSIYRATSVGAAPVKLLLPADGKLALHAGKCSVVQLAYECAGACSLEIRLAGKAQVHSSLPT